MHQQGEEERRGDGKSRDEEKSKDEMSAAALSFSLKKVFDASSCGASDFFAN